MILDDILANAERLISDARYLCDAGRHRSAATLIVVALEHFGLFVEELTQEKHPGAIAYMGIFGNKNAHSRRQDALASHVMNFAQGQMLLAVTSEAFFLKTGCGDPHKYMQWLTQAVPITFTKSRSGAFRKILILKPRICCCMPFGKTALKCFANMVCMKMSR
jgi:hypothetical protein